MLLQSDNENHQNSPIFAGKKSLKGTHLHRIKTFNMVVIVEVPFIYLLGHLIVYGIALLQDNTLYCVLAEVVP